MLQIKDKVKIKTPGYWLDKVGYIKKYKGKASHKVHGWDMEEVSIYLVELLDGRVFSFPENELERI